MSSINVLVVDDHKDWRKFVRLALLMRPDLQVIGEASDGPEAVQKAEELKPDFILLDIGLPTLNGIEAARQIRQLSPNSKIIFLSADDSLDMVHTAMNTGGGLGYVYKADAQSDLLRAIDAVLRGEQFISRLEGRKLSDAQRTKAHHRHEVLFYANDTILLDHLTRFVLSALRGGNAAIVLATQSHRDSLLRRLRERRVDVDHAIQQGTYISLDAADTLSKIMVSDLPDPIRFFEGIGGLIESAARATKTVPPRVAVFGEAVALLLAEGNADAAIRFEQLGNGLIMNHEIEILCAYPLSSFHKDKHQHIFRNICAEHTAVFTGK